MMRRSVVVGLVAWVSVVTVASGVTWAVIDTAGQEVLSEDAVATAVPELTEAVSSTPPSASASGGSVRRSGTPESPSVASPPPSPATSGGARPVQEYTDRTWHGTPGTVVARCTGSAADLRSATPNDDYYVEVESDGEREVEVKFESASGHEVKVKVDCAGGAPRFKVESDAEGGE
jgi:hypothetical protein